MEVMSLETPIIVGVGDVTNRSQAVEDAIEPMRLMLNAIHIATRDTGLEGSRLSTLHSSIDSVDVVRTWTYPYKDLPGLLAEELGATPEHKCYSGHGGHQPGKLIDEAARRVSKGESKLAIVSGGEALASLAACYKADKIPPPSWTSTDEDISTASPLSQAIDESSKPPNVGAIHSVGLPIHVYPMYENALRAHHRQSKETNERASAKMYADFAKVASENPNSWNYRKHPASESVIATATKKNRMICYPYPLLMNAFNTVNMAAACLITSTSFAKELGIPEEKWVYVLGGAGTMESANFWERPSFHTSYAISRSLDAAISTSGLSANSIDVFDFYSCFPIIPKLACAHLGLPVVNTPEPITLLGGLTSFGGAGNNYSMHAFTEMTRRLRKGQGKTGLILANGGIATYEHAVCISANPRRDGQGYPAASPLPSIVEDVPVPQFVSAASGEAILETYTVEYSRDGSPSIAHIVGRLTKDDYRFIANSVDQTTFQQLTSGIEEPITKKGHVIHDEKTGRNFFSFARNPSRL